MTLDLTLTTPGLLFSIISLLMVAYNNRFHNLSTIIRQLDGKTGGRDGENILSQIFILKRRLFIIRRMQIYGIFSLIFSIFSILMIFFQSVFMAKILFIGALISLVITLSFAVSEVFISTTAIEMEVERHMESININELDEHQTNVFENNYGDRVFLTTEGLEA